MTKQLKRATMADVAKLAGVSSQTVSRVSNGSAKVAGDTHDRVVKAMRELGYRRNPAARALKRGKFQSIGVITFTLDTFGNLHTVEALANAAAKVGCTITLIMADDRTIGAVSGAYARLADASVDAVALLLEAQLVEDQKLEFPPGLPVIMIDSDPAWSFPLVDTDQAQGARQATRHLLDLGHRRIAHVAGPRTSFAAKTREKSCIEELEQENLEPAAIIEGDWSIASGEAAIDPILDSGATAVFTSNDEMALGVLRAAHRRQLSIPGDLSVVGFDNSSIAESTWPALTSVDQNFAEVGRICIDILTAKDGAQDLQPRKILVGTRLVERDSTAPIGQSEPASKR